MPLFFSSCKYIVLTFTIHFSHKPSDEANRIPDDDLRACDICCSKLEIPFIPSLF